MAFVLVWGLLQGNMSIFRGMLQAFGDVANSKRLASGDATAAGEAYGYPLRILGEGV